MQSIFNSPNPILFGTGTVKQLGDKLKELGCSNVLLVYDQGIKNAGIADRVAAVIEGAGLKTVRFEDVQADPPDWSVEQAGKLGKDNGIDGVVGLGGGSSMDTAKGAKLLQTNPPPLRQYFGRTGIVTKPSVPLIVIPTTAGTGSECTPGGTITDSEQNIKTNIAGVGCQVTLGIVDPELTAALPPSVTASTGLDALCHCVESFTSNLANSFSEVVGRRGIELVAKYLVRAVEDGSDMEAREGMSLAAILGGMAMSGALCHLAHDIGRALAAYHIPHGTACASCLPQVLQAIAPAKPEQLKFYVEQFGRIVPEGATPEEIGAMAYEETHRLIKRVKLPNLRSFGLTKQQVLDVAPAGVVRQSEGMIKSFGATTSPIPVTLELVADICSRAYDEN